MIPWMDARPGRRGAPASEGGMSEGTTTRQTRITGEWWWIAALIDALHRFIEISDNNYPSELRHEAHAGGGWSASIHQGGREIGNIKLTPDDAATNVQIVCEPAYQSFWARLWFEVDNAAKTARETRRSAHHSSAEGAIEYYYRARAQGRRISLGQIAADTGFSEAYLRKVKVSYDKAGKWGSKRKR